MVGRFECRRARIGGGVGRAAGTTRGRPLRVLYAFDPCRVALLLLGGDKTGDDRWYDISVPIADGLYAEHLAMLKKGGKHDG